MQQMEAEFKSANEITDIHKKKKKTQRDRNRDRERNIYEQAGRQAKRQTGQKVSDQAVILLH